jgi:tRNA dimethylallyltransferase
VAQLQFLILAGPTASGKSELALKIAQRLSTEIVGADAYQIYQGFDVLSGKPSPALLEQVPHHLIGTLPTTELGDAARYAEQATAVIDSLNQRGRIPLVVGGTGFYLKALTHPLPDLPVPDTDLRKELASIPLPSLLQELKGLDPLAFEQIDRRNRRRVSRAVEVCRQTGRPFSSFRTTFSGANFIALWVNWPRAELYSRIDARVDQILASGAIQEVATAGPLGPTASQMIGIAEISRYLRNEISLAQCAAEIKQATRQLAKRQLTWFRAQPYTPVSPDLPLSEIVSLYREGMKRER